METVILTLAGIVTATIMLVAPVQAQTRYPNAAGYPGNYGNSQPSAGSPGNYGGNSASGSNGVYGNANRYDSDHYNSNNYNSDNYNGAPPPQVVPNRVYVQPLPSILPGYRERQNAREWQDRDDRANYQRDRRNRSDGWDGRDRDHDRGRDLRRGEGVDGVDGRTDGRAYYGKPDYPTRQRDSRDVWRR